MPNCSAINCSNGAHNGFKVHRFPREQSRRSVWIQNCRRDNWTPNDAAVLCDVSIVSLGVCFFCIFFCILQSDSSMVSNRSTTCFSF